MRIIWATDGSKGSEAALPYLRGLLDGPENEVVVTAVAPAPLLSEARPDPSMLLWHLIPAYRERVSEEVTELVVRQTQLLEGCRAHVTSVIGLGSAPNEIMKLAVAEQADLVVTGAHGHTGAREILIGSVSRQVAVNAACSVLVARGRRQPRRILVAVDGSPDAEAGVTLLASLTPPRSAEVTLVHADEDTAQVVAEESGVAAVVVNEVHQPRSAAVRAQLDAALSTLREASWNAEPHVVGGHPASALLDAVQSLSADLLVIGARGTRSVHPEARGMGSVSHYLLEHAPSAVLVARTPRPVQRSVRRIR